MINIYGFVGKPEFAQKSAIQYFFVNGRYMRHPYFHKAVLLAYNQMIQATESPNYFIYFDVDPQTIDVNIHPTKTEIKFENEQAIWSILSASVKEALGKFNVVPSIDFDQEGSLDLNNLPILHPENIRPPQTNFNPEYNPFGTSNYKRPVLDWEDLYGGFEKRNKSTAIHSDDAIDVVLPSGISEAIDSQQQIEISCDTKSDNFQYKNRFIITSIKSGLLMIEQHRAHLRILYDTFINQIEQRKAFSQQVLFPEIFELTVDDHLIFEQMMTDLNCVGFDFDKLENYTYSVKGIPDLLGTVSVIDLLLNMLDTAKTSGDDFANNLHHTISLSMAESSSVKVGQRLTSEEMNDIIDRLFACANYNTSPDGKKIMTIFTSEEIEKLFSR